jgi:hypothetical protein
MSRYLIVNYANGRFLRGRDRLVATCLPLGHSIVCYGDEDLFTSHKDSPYYFKIDALLKASQRADILLWADSSIFATGKGPLNPIFEHVEREGYYLQKNGWNNAQWCNDTSLFTFGFTRDEAEKQDQVNAACYGISPRHPTGKLILDELVHHRDMFKGAWSNDHETESHDVHCLGHRHDQSVLSLIAAKHHLTVHSPSEHMWFTWGRNPDYLLNLEGIG